MTERMSRAGLARFARENWANLVILVVCGLFFAESLTLRGDAGKYPLVVASITAALVLLDMLNGAMRPAVEPAEPPVEGATLTRKLMAGGWIALTLVLLYVIGVIAAIAVAASLYFYIFVFRRALPALLAGLGHALVFWLAFDVLAGFRLHPGIF